MAGKFPVDPLGNMFGDVVFGNVLGREVGNPVGNVSDRVVFGLDRRFELAGPVPLAIELVLGVRNLFINRGGSAMRRFWLGGNGLSGVPLSFVCVYEVNEALDSADSEGNLPGSPESLPRM